MINSKKKGDTMKESKTLEFKETVTKTFLKTVSAFSNYGGGKIIFGIDDNGNVKGIEKSEDVCIDIENSINDNISPQPKYNILVNDDRTITLTVFEGDNKPYFYKSKAYKRNDTATIEVDTFELTRLILESKKINFEELKAEKQELEFTYLSQQLKKHIQIETFNKDILKTLNLYNEKNGYNNAANILSDNNIFPGIDIAIFGDTINIIKKRTTLENMSLLQMYDKTVEIFKDNYQYEEIDGSYRKKVELIPEEAFREALANALIHRSWDLNARIRIAMFNDKIEISSPGGLPSGISVDEYLCGMISLRRNPIISNIFYRLGIVEIFGTRILRINQAYENSIRKPIFNLSENAIQIILPVLNNFLIEDDQEIIYNALGESKSIPISEIVSNVPFGRTKTKELLKKMEKDGIVKVVGKGKATKYHI